MMKTRLATPAKLVDINGIPGLDTLERGNGHLRVGALVRHADVAASDLTFGAVALGRAVDLRSAGAQPRHALRLGRALRPRGRLELGAARHRRRRRSPAAPTASGSIPITEFIVDFFSERARRRRDGHRGAHPGPVRPRRVARTRSSSARSATTPPSPSPRTSSWRPTAPSRRAGLALTAVNPVNTKVTAAEEMLVGQQPTIEAVRRRGRARRAGRGAARRRARLGRVEAQRRPRVHPPGARAQLLSEAQAGSRTEPEPSNKEAERGSHRHDQRHRPHARRRAAHAPRRLHPHAGRAHRHAHRLRHHQLRRVHGAASTARR